MLVRVLQFPASL